MGIKASRDLEVKGFEGFKTFMDDLVSSEADTRVQRLASGSKPQTSIWQRIQRACCCKRQKKRDSRKRSEGGSQDRKSDTFDEKWIHCQIGLLLDLYYDDFKQRTWCKSKKEVLNICKDNDDLQKELMQNFLSKQSEDKTKLEFRKEFWVAIDKYGPTKDKKEDDEGSPAR